MRKTRPFLVLAGSFLLASCAIPGKETAEPEPVEPPETGNAASGEPVAFEEPPVPAIEDHGLRLPDMLSLPDDGDFRATNLPSGRTGEAGPVVSRPPTDPPSRPKPQQENPEE